jgi:hypothetical protein
MATTQAQSTSINSSRALTALLALVAGGLIVATLVAVAVALAPSKNATANADPLGQPSVVAFRQSEHADAISNRDPLAAPALIAFRQSEHAVSAPVNFRDSERSDNYGTQWSKDPLAAPNIVQFRNSEHSEAGR